MNSASVKAAIKNAIIGSLRLAGRRRLEVVRDALVRTTHIANGQLRRLEAESRTLPVIASFDGSEDLRPSILSDRAPWNGIDVDELRIPGMISLEECQYFQYLGKFYTGQGAVVELGPWLGRSTACIVRGLSKNPHFRGQKLHVYDDFVWRSEWMDGRLGEREQPGNHQDFLFLFKEFTSAIAEHIDVQKGRLFQHDGNEGVEALTWDGRPIEMMWVDTGRDILGNEAWWTLFAHAFIPGRTLLVLQDWGTHREVPVKWYNQIKQFTDSKGQALQLVHELKNGSSATFLFQG